MGLNSCDSTFEIIYFTVSIFLMLLFVYSSLVVCKNVNDDYERESIVSELSFFVLGFFGHLISGSHLTDRGKKWRLVLIPTLILDIGLFLVAGQYDICIGHT